MNKALEDLQAGRGIYASVVKDKRGAEFYAGLATATLTLPLFTGLLCYYAVEALEGIKGPAAVWVRLGTLALAALLLLMTLVLGGIALSGIPRYGRERILGRTLSGMAISLIFIGFMVAGYGQGLRNHSFLAALETSASKMQAEVKQDLKENPDGPTAKEQARRLGRMKEELAVAAEGTSGDMALFAKASGVLLEQMQAATVHYAKASQLLKEHPVLQFEGVQRREQLQDKRELVRQFLMANQELISWLANRETLLRKELEKQKLPPEKIESALNGLRKKNENFELSLKIREQDRLMGSAMLNMLSILEANWGNWRYDAQRRKVIFQDHDALEKYLSDARQLQEAVQEQKKLQSSFVTVLSS